MSTAALLNERQTTHGNFEDNARFAQAFRALCRQSEHWAYMQPEHREAMDQIAGKFSRILSGQSAFLGHWEDVAGYAELAKKACP